MAEDPNLQQFIEMRQAGIPPDRAFQFIQDNKPLDNFERSFRHTILDNEGGKLVDRNVEGVVSKYGIRQKTLDDLKKLGQFTDFPDRVENLSENQARQLLRKEFYERPKINTISNDNIQSALFDVGVHLGPERAIGILQNILGVKPDMLIGPITKKAIQDADEQVLLRRFLDESFRELQGTENFDKFEKGFQNRLLNNLQFFGLE